MPLTSHRIGVRAVIVRDEAILAIEYNDPHDSNYPLHYNLPGGGVEEGESLHDALRRELREEAGVEINIGSLLLVDEYVPAHYNNHFGTLPKLTLYFSATLQDGEEPHLPPILDPMQTGIRWLPLSGFPYPYITSRILDLLTQPTNNYFSNTETYGLNIPLL